MRTRSIRDRLIVGALGFAVLAASCGGSSGAQGLAEQSAADVEPPPALDTKRTGLAGVVVATNSPSFRQILEAPRGEGAVVLFVEPGGPSDGLGIGRGDVITAIDGQEIRNHQRALALLHTRPGQRLDVEFRRRDGSERTVTVEPREPKVQSLRQYLNPMVSGSPNDAILRYVRAQSAGELRGRLADVNKALEIEPRFVEALTLRASLLWDNRPRNRSRAVPVINDALAGWKGAIDIDPENTTALTARSTALTALGNPNEGRKDAAKAVGLDETLPRAYYALALAERALRRNDRAAGPARAAVELDPFNVPYWRLLGVVFMALRRADDCRRTVNGFAPFLEARGFERDANSLRSVCRR